MRDRRVKLLCLLLIGLGACGSLRADDSFSSDFAPMRLMQIVNPADKADRPEGIRDREYELTAGISYSLIDEKLSVGVETEASLIDEAGRRGNFHNEVKIGPSIQWRPIPQMHVDFAPLIGVTNESPAAKIYLVIGFEF